MDHLADRFQGSIAALAVADALGAPFEGRPVERLVWWLIGRSGGRRRWTDDTQMTLDLIESLVACGKLDCSDAAHRFARSYRWSRGYGPGTAKVLRCIRTGTPWAVANRRGFRNGSFGNGGAMRVAAVALFYGIDRSQSALSLCELARLSAAVTHAHSIAQNGAACLATATIAAMNNARPAELLDAVRITSREPALQRRLDAASALLNSEKLAPAAIAAEIGNGVSAAESCVASILIGARHLDRPFSELLHFCRKTGGDVDTIGAMAGSIWGARNGLSAIPIELLDQVEAAEMILRAGLSLFEAASKRIAETL